MKSILLFLSIVIIGVSSAKAQISYTCSYQQLCFWNENSNKYDNCIGGELVSVVEVNMEETIITQIIATEKSVYQIQTKKYDRRKKLTIYTAINDKADEYYYAFDAKKKEVKVIFKKEGKTALLIYSQSYCNFVAHFRY
jgi:hypothetical protein